MIEALHLAILLSTWFLSLNLISKDLSLNKQIEEALQLAPKQFCHLPGFYRKTSFLSVYPLTINQLPGAFWREMPQSVLPHVCAHSTSRQETPMQLVLAEGPSYQRAQEGSPKNERFHNGKTNSAAFCVIQQISVIPLPCNLNN